jgi:hypothetical protein
VKGRGGTYQASLEPLASITCERIVTLPPVGLDRYVECLNDARTKLAEFFSALLEVESYLGVGVAEMFANPHLLLVLAQ